MIRKLFHILFVFAFFMNTSNLLASTNKSVAGISFSLPDSWKETPPSSSMRIYQFEIPGEKEQNAEVAVFYFGEGQGGGVQENIQRWKSQFTQLSKEQTDEKNVSGIKVTEVFLLGSYQQTMGPMMSPQGEPKENFCVLGAIIEAPQGAVFLKMTGPKDVVNSTKSDFDALIGSLKKS